MLCLSACNRGPGKLEIEALPIPPGRLELRALLPSAVPGKLQFACGELANNGTRLESQVATSFSVDTTGAAPVLLPAESLKLIRDARPDCLLADGNVLVTQYAGTDRVRAVRMEGRPYDISPDNYAAVMHIAGLPGKGIADSDKDGNLYLRIRREGGLTELWVGDKALVKVDMPEHIRCMGGYWGSQGRQVLVVTEDGTAHIVDPLTASLAASPQIAWAAAAAATDGLDLSQLRYLALNDKLALLRFADEIRAYSAEGAEISVGLLSPEEYKPDGSQREPGEAAKLAEQPQYLLAEARSLPPTLASRSSSCVALDPDSVAIVDRDYYRVLLLRADGPRKHERVN